jgi:GAF domain-containing protein
MPASTHDVRLALEQLAAALLDDVERIAKRGVARMQELLPSYSKVPAEALIPVTVTNMRHLLQAVLDPEANPRWAEGQFRVSGETPIGQGIKVEDMLQAWRIAVRCVREEALVVARELGIADGVLLEFIEATLQCGDVGMPKSARAHREMEIRELERVAAEHAALRRVATLVARGVPQEELFAAVTAEVGRVLVVDTAAMSRYEPDRTMTTMAVWSRTGDNIVAIGSRHRLGGQNTSTLVLETGRPARIDDYPDASDSIAAVIRDLGVRSVVGAPISVEGRLWGVIHASSRQPLPADAEQRLTSFTELVATAIANSENSSGLARLAEEQGALRRVATLVADGLEPQGVFAAVADEVHCLFGADITAIVRFEEGRTVTVMGVHGGPHDPGTRIELDPGYVGDSVRATGRAARFDTDDPAADDMPWIVRAQGIRSALASPIVVSGQVWGAVTAATSGTDPMSADAESRIEQFTELVATAVSNVQARTEVERLAAEQTALRRVATLVARKRPPDEVFAQVAEEVGLLLEADTAGVCRYERDEHATLIAAWGRVGGTLPLGSRFRLDDDSVTALVYRTERPARFDAYEAATGPVGEYAREVGLLSACGAPIFVGGRLWGSLVVASSRREAMIADAESRMAEFTELVATAISNIQALSDVEELADEQAALRRVATLVAQGAPPSAVFDAVAAEMNHVLRAGGVTLSRFEPDEEVVVLAHIGSDPRRLPAGTRVSHRGENVTSLVRSSERSARLEHHAGTPGPIAAIVGKLGVQASVGAPIIVDGRLWGVAVANLRGDESPPGETEERMAKFAELLDTAIANADSRDQLTASRARLLTEADEARRRVVRDLHDGAQQRLVHTIVTLKLAQRALQGNDAKAESLISEALEQAQQGNAELRELAHGILPAVLAQGGLHTGVNSIVSRLQLPVEVDIPAKRFPAEIEASAYFVVAEALTNVVKHSHAGHAEVRARVDDGMLHVEVSDDGVGGPDPNGHGLVGLADRVTALGGWLEVSSPPSGGTLLSAALPLSTG